MERHLVPQGGAAWRPRKESPGKISAQQPTKRIAGQNICTTQKVLAPMPAESRYENTLDFNAGSGCSSHAMFAISRLAAARQGLDDARKHGKRLPSWPLRKPVHGRPGSHATAGRGMLPSMAHHAANHGRYPGKEKSHPRRSRKPAREEPRLLLQAGNSVSCRRAPRSGEQPRSGTPHLTHRPPLRGPGVSRIDLFARGDSRASVRKFLTSHFSLLNFVTLVPFVAKIPPPLTPPHKTWPT